MFSAGFNTTFAFLFSSLVLEVYHGYWIASSSIFSNIIMVLQWYDRVSGILSRVFDLTSGTFNNCFILALVNGKNGSEATIRLAVIWRAE